MPINDYHKTNYDVLRRAVSNGDTALIECTDNKTGEVLIVLCAVTDRDEKVDLVPLARMFMGNPFEEVTPNFPTDIEERSRSDIGGEYLIVEGAEDGNGGAG